MMELEDRWFSEGKYPICGVDEAGRGPLAGPVCAAAVILPRGIVIEGLDDSKKLSENKREQLYAVITEKALCWSAAFASVEEIEEINILNATFLAMMRAVDGLALKPKLALVDGNRDPKLGIETVCIVGGDGKYADIAAASVIAKVTRDRLMYEYDKKWSQYGFAKHKGYGTKEHCEAIMKYGVCEAHRPSFLKKLKSEGSPWTKSLPDVGASR